MQEILDRLTLSLVITSKYISRAPRQCLAQKSITYLRKNNERKQCHNANQMHEGREGPKVYKNVDELITCKNKPHMMLNWYIG